MCLASLYVSTTCPLSHRWYHLLKPCTPTANLSSCPSKKIALEGWEIKASFCPWCDGWNPSAETYLLLNSASNICSPLVSGAGGPLSRVPSTVQPVSEARRDSRRSSLSRTSSSGSFGAGGSFGGQGPVASARERNGEMNGRFDEYLNGGGQMVLERSRSSGGGVIGEENGTEGDGGSWRNANGNANGDSLMSRGWNKARKKSKDLSVFWK